MGSGTTAIASRQLSRNFIGFERNKEYHKIATERVKFWKKAFKNPILIEQNKQANHLKKIACKPEQKELFESIK